MSDLINRLRDYDRMHAAKDMIEAADRIEQLEAALWVFTGVLRTPSSYINDAYELHVKRVEYEKACAALAPKQDK